MTKLDVNPEIRKAITQEVKAYRNKTRANTKYEADKVTTKKRGDEIRNKIEMDNLLKHHDRLWFEELLSEL